MSGRDGPGWPIFEEETRRPEWRAMETAPRDGTEIVVYCPPAHGLNHMASVCAWHEDAGFCVCELREPTLWIHLPKNAKSAATGSQGDDHE